MISEHTRAAIVALLAVDPNATDAEREAVATLMTGESQGPAVLTIKEVCKRLGRTRQTVYNLVKRGMLSAVTNGSTTAGITLDSLNRYLRGAA